MSTKSLVFLSQLCEQAIMGCVSESVWGPGGAIRVGWVEYTHSGVGWAKCTTFRLGWGKSTFRLGWAKSVHIERCECENKTIHNIHKCSTTTNVNCNVHKHEHLSRNDLCGASFLREPAVLKPSQ